VEREKKAWRAGKESMKKGKERERNGS